MENPRTIRLSNGKVIVIRPLNTMMQEDNNSRDNGVVDVQEVPREVPSSPQVEDWSNGATKLLLDKYAQYLPQIGPMKKFRTKKAMWEQVSMDLNAQLKVRKSWVQCDSRYKTIMKRKKSAKENNNTSGSSRKSIEFEEELQAIAGIDDSLEPSVLMSTSACTLNKKQTVEPWKKNKKLDLILKLHQEKEASRRRRHQEKLQTLKEIGNKLANAIQAKSNNDDYSSLL